MHSKWKVWDLVKSRPSVIDSKFKVICFQTFNPFVFSILKDKVDMSLFEEDRLLPLIGKEVSTSWVDDNLKSLNLFGNSDSYLVHFAEELKDDVCQELLNIDELILDGRYLILSFNKDSALLRKLKKLDSDLVEVIHVQPPAFWEEGELLNFFSDYFKVYLSYEAVQEVRNKVKFDFGVYFQLFQSLQINFSENNKELSALDLADFLADDKIDQFELVELFATKRFGLFYKKFVRAFESGADLVSLIYFIESHLTKIYDPSFLSGKTKLTKYDKQIQSQHNMWKPEEIIRSLNYFGELLTLAKKKDRMLEYRIKTDFLKTLRV